MARRKDLSTDNLRNSLREVLEMYYEKFNRMYNNPERTLFRIPGDCGFSELGDDCVYIDWMGFDGQEHCYFKVNIFDLIFQVNQEFIDNVLFKYLVWCKLAEELNRDYDEISKVWVFRIYMKLHNWFAGTWMNKWFGIKPIPGKTKIPRFVEYWAARDAGYCKEEDLTF